MNDFNQILLEGRIDKLDFAVLQDGTYYVKVILNTAKTIRNKDGIETKTAFFPVEFYGAGAYDYIKARAREGKRARITGRLAQRSRWDDVYSNIAIIGEYIELAREMG